MKASNLTQRIQIERPIIRRDDYGAEITEWQPESTVWANIRFPSGKEYQAVGVDLNSVAASFRIRLNRRITSQMRIIFRGQIYAILAILHDEQNRKYTDIVANLQAGEGK